MTPTHLYHVPQTRSARILWTLLELGAPYELTALTTDTGDRSLMSAVPPRVDGSRML